MFGLSIFPSSRGGECCLVRPFAIPSRLYRPLHLKRPTTQILDWCRTVSLNAFRRNRHVRKTFCVSNNDGPHRTGHNCECSERTRATGDLHKRCGAHSPAVLPNLPPSRFDCADVVTNV